MRRIDRMMEKAHHLYDELQPAFFLAFIHQMKGGYRLECQLMEGIKQGEVLRVSFHSDMEDAKRRIDEMSQKYPAVAAPVVILDNIPEGG